MTIRRLQLPEGPSGEKDVNDWRDRPEALRQARVVPQSPQPPRKREELDSSDYLGLARSYLEERYTTPEGRTLHYYCGGWHHWDGVRYREIPAEEVQGPIWTWLESVHIRPKRNLVAEVMAALQAITCLPSTINSPCWLDDTHPLSEAGPYDVVALPGGLLRLSTREIYHPTPCFFNHHALGTRFDPNAPSPVNFLNHLNEMYAGDQEVIQLHQEYLGYLVSGQTDQQKALLMVSPKRGGKGTTLRVYRALLGPENVAGPTLTTMGGSFGLESLLYQSTAIIGDARISGRAEWSVIAERLLSITGEDTLTVERKFRPAWTGQLRIRFVIASNELPKLTDASSALVGRFVVAISSRSWYGEEDPGLITRLLSELPGILIWALDGLDRLRSRGRFCQPTASLEAVRALEDLGSPVSAFLREEIVIAPDGEAIKRHVYERWRDWCAAHGYPRPTSEAAFGRDLRAALPAIRTTRPREGSERIQKWAGIRLRSTTDSSEEDV